MPYPTKPAALAIGVVAAMIAGAFLVSAQDSAGWPEDASRYRVYMVGQAHIDAVWLWPWYESMAVVDSTFRSALDRMTETSGFAFTASSAQFYEWLSENDPATLDAIRKRVKEGRWDAVGGWWVEPDVNLPSGESLIRQGLYGQRTFKRLLGQYATTGFNPDSFGHAGTLPQILKLQGMNNYVFMRPQAKEKTLPSDLFWWEAPDGTRALTYRIPISYNDDKDVSGRIKEILQEAKPPLQFMAFYGAGDHGGGATKENIKSIAALQHEPGAPKVLYSTPDQYFSDVRASDVSTLPVVKDDLQHHSVGCYTAESAMKKQNRTTEIRLVSAEKLAAIGALAWQANYPKDSFTAAWKRVLFLQFHDSLAGTALPEHYETTVPEGYGFASDIAEQATRKAAAKLEAQVPATDPESKYLLVFNLHPWPVSANIEYDLAWNPGTPALVEDEAGKPVAFQLTRPTTEVNDRQRLVAQLQLPPFGYRQIRIRKTTTAPAPAENLQTTDKTLENAFLRLSVHDDGSISLFDKTARRDVFESGKSGASAIVINDPSDTWSHNVRAYTEEMGSFGSATSSLIENGPLRARLRVRSVYDHSTLTTDWLLYAGGKTVEARVSLDWHEHEKIFKFSFPVAVESPRSTYEIAYGNIVRDTNGDENPGQRWIDLSGQADDHEYGLAVINDAKYGYSVEGNDMRLSVVRGAPYAHHIPHVLNPAVDHLWQDQGVQQFRMLLVPHQGTWQSAGLQRTTEEFTTPVPIQYQGIHPGTRPTSASFLDVDAPDVVISAMKQSEEGHDLILRAYETDGHRSTAAIQLRFAHKRWSGSFRPYEIKTLRFNPTTGKFTEVNALEEAAHP